MQACQIKENKKMAMRMRGGGAGHRGRPVANVKLMEQMRAMQDRMKAMELARKRNPDLGDDSKSKVEGSDQEKEATPEIAKMKLLRSLLGSNSRPKPSLSIYDGNFST